MNKKIDYEKLCTKRALGSQKDNIVTKLIWFGIGSLCIGTFIISIILIIPSDTTKNYYAGYEDGYDWGYSKGTDFCGKYYDDYYNRVSFEYYDKESYLIFNPKTEWMTLWELNTQYPSCEDVKQDVLTEINNVTCIK